MKTVEDSDEAIGEIAPDMVKRCTNLTIQSLSVVEAPPEAQPNYDSALAKVQAQYQQAYAAQAGQAGPEAAYEEEAAYEDEQPQAGPEEAEPE